MLSRHERRRAISATLLARGRLRWRLCDVLECGAGFFVTVITRQDPRAADFCSALPGQIAPQNRQLMGRGTVIAGFFNPLDDHRPRNLYYLRRFQSWSRFPPRE